MLPEYNHENYRIVKEVAIDRVKRFPTFKDSVLERLFLAIDEKESPAAAANFIIRHQKEENTLRLTPREAEILEEIACEARKKGLLQTSPWKSITRRGFTAAAGVAGIASAASLIKGVSLLNQGQKFEDEGGAVKNKTNAIDNELSKKEGEALDLDRHAARLKKEDKLMDEKIKLLTQQHTLYDHAAKKYGEAGTHCVIAVGEFGAGALSLLASYLLNSQDKKNSFRAHAEILEINQGNPEIRKGIFHKAFDQLRNSNKRLLEYSDRLIYSTEGRTA